MKTIINQVRRNREAWIRASSAFAGALLVILVFIGMGATQTPMQALEDGSLNIPLSDHQLQALQAHYLSRLTGASQPAGGSVTPTQMGAVVPDATATPKVLSATPIYTRKFVVKGNKDFRTANVGTVYVGPSPTNGRQVFDIGAGVERTFEAPLGSLLNLADFYVDSETLNDGVMVFYF